MIRVGTVSSLVVATILGGTYYLRHGSSGAFPIKVIEESSVASDSWENASHTGAVRRQPTILSAAPDTASGLQVSESPHGAPFRSPAMLIYDGTESGATVPLPGFGTAPQAAENDSSTSPPLGTGDEVSASSSLRPDCQERLRGRLVLDPGASFWNLAERAYGTGSYFRALYAYNRDRVPSPDRVHGGEVIEIPDEAVLKHEFPELCPGALETARASSGIFRPTR